MDNAVRSNYRNIEVCPIDGALGAEINGVDISQSLDGEVISEIRQAFLDHLMIFFRDQNLTPQEQLAFAEGAQPGEARGVRPRRGQAGRRLPTGQDRLDVRNPRPEAAGRRLRIPKHAPGHRRSHMGVECLREQVQKAPVNRVGV